MKYYCNCCRDTGWIEVDPISPHEAGTIKTATCPHLYLENGEYDALDNLSKYEIDDLPRDLLEEAYKEGFLQDSTIDYLKKILF